MSKTWTQELGYARGGYLSLAALPFAPKPEVKVNGKLGWDTSKKACGDIIASRALLVMVAREHLGKKQVSLLS